MENLNSALLRCRVWGLFDDIQKTFQAIYFHCLLNFYLSVTSEKPITVPLGAVTKAFGW